MKTPLALAALSLVAALFGSASACDDAHGIHCIPGAGPKSWECPGRLFEKEKRGITDTFCSNECCLCITRLGGGRCTPDDLVDGAEIFINPYFPNTPYNGTCGWCPKGTEKEYYGHKCYDQRVVGFDAPLNSECAQYKPLRTGMFPNGPGNVPPPPIDIKAAFARFAPLPPRNDSEINAMLRPKKPRRQPRPVLPTFGIELSDDGQITKK